MIDRRTVDALRERRLGPEHKSVPPSSWGLTVDEFLGTGPTLADFQTPVVSLDRTRLTSNIAVMADWAAAAGVDLAPHGKTTMAPALWREQLVAGSWAITLATPWQVQLARAFGVQRIMLANALVDPVALRWISAELDEHPEFDFLCWADSEETVVRMAEILGSPGRPVNVVVELGGPHGRTGARTVDAAVAVARRVADTPGLALAGVGGYEGALAHDRTPDGLAAVARYLDAVADLHRTLVDQNLYPGAAVVTAGGSAYPDLVVRHLAELTENVTVPTRVVLRSGAYLVHDDGFYADISPLIESRVGAAHLASAMHGWARVVSRPEPELALLDAGKRDVPFDEGLPTPQRIDTADVPADQHISAVNDQHAFLRMPSAGPDHAPVGSVVRLGLSHPCTAFDKWRLLPVVDDADGANPRVVDLIHTFF
ncbi:alanine racemase [Rhodococcoides corynebacterioides]|uniref:Alanine racemase n=1 Tax=Rhodococcoides corynebacterioides TaxID=53972 RepID=A0ABS7P258_9NOCA|nr:alanine racemase [Rhodococcus corynebacterioides]MBY6366473.1 alanine racemase [Rhodococcus corynebacterioides]MBY6407073.1 alanine racemase [Rhodococcus corynebacterioides]